MSLGCILLLLLNDHVFKPLFPSVWTGKLSDFAGVFFIPFLFILFLSPIAALIPGRSKAIPVIAFWFAGIWFAAVKLSGPVNESTEVLAGILRGGRVVIVQDPTDVLALVMLWPAWRLWRPLSGQAAPARSRGLLAAGFGLALFASLATSPCYHEGRVTRLVEIDGVLYSDYPANSDLVVVSFDLGETWVSTSEFSESVLDALEKPTEFPEIICLTGRPDTCYRISGENRIEIRRDGGDSWQVDWSLSPARFEFLDRKAGQLNCGKTPDFMVFDLVLIETEGREVLIAALGNEGILVNADGQSWERRAVLEASPTPLRAVSLSDAWSLVFWEILVSIFAAFLLYITLTTVVLNRLTAKRWLRVDKPSAALFTPMVARFGGVLVLCVLLVYLALEANLPEAFNLPIFLLIGWLLLAGMVVPWRRAADHASDRARVIRGGWETAGLGLFALLISWTWLFVWAFGVIAGYEIALVLLVLSEIGLLFFGLRAIFRRFPELPDRDPGNQAG